MGRVMTYELDSAFAAAANDPAVRVVVLAADGDHFCSGSGHDLGTADHLADLAAELHCTPRGAKLAAVSCFFHGHLW